MNNKKVFRTFFKNFSSTISFSAIFWIGLFVWFLISFFILRSVNIDSLLLLALVLLFFGLLLAGLTPFLYSYFVNSVSLLGSNRDEVGIKSFFKMISVGFSTRQSKSLHIIKNLFLSFFIYLGISAIGTVIMLAIVLSNNLEIRDALTNFEGSFNELVNTIYIYKDVFYPGELIINFVSILFASMYFLHQIGINMFKFIVMGALLPINERYRNIYFKKALKERRKDFYPSYYKISFILLIIFIISFSASYFGFYSVHGVYTVVPLVTLVALTVSIFILIPFIPLLFYRYSEMAPNYINIITQTIFSSIKVEVANARKNSITKDQQMEIDRFEKEVKEVEQKVNKNLENNDIENLIDKNDDEEE